MNSKEKVVQLRIGHDYEKILGKYIPTDRLTDEQIRLIDNDFTDTTKVLKQWIIDHCDILFSYFSRESKKNEMKFKSFADGMKYLRDMLILDLAFGGDKVLEDKFMEELAPLVQSDD